MLELQLRLQNYQVSVKANGKESHQFSLLDLNWPQTKAEIKAFVSKPTDVGTKLFDALFKDSSGARKAFNALSKQTERTIVLVLESSELDGVAWEYAYNKAKEEYVVEDCAFVRALPEKERPANGRFKNEVDRVPLLFIPANPLVDLSGEPMRALDVDGEWREMKRLIEKSNAPFDMLELRPGTPEALQSVMARFQNGMIAHFSGHGAARKDGAILLFERENGASNPLEAREFVREVKDKAWIGFLSACQSAVPERTEFSNLARELAKAGVPFALGMQFNLPDPFAPNISGQFYNYLAHGHAVPEAARQARRAVKRENEFFVGMIALYAAHPDEVGKLAWRGAGAQTVSLFRPADVSDLPSPASGLIGRQRELMRIGTRLLEDKKPLTVTLHGAGGIGKTALLWQALLRFAPSFELTLAIGLDPLPSLESVLGRIERFLGSPSPCSNDTKEREALVRNALTNKRALLGLDNFETLNYALNEKGSDEEKTAKSLHAFFKSLAANSVTLCVTSREVTNLPGETVQDIQGLTNENGGRLFQEYVVRQKDEIYIEKTQQISEMVGGHPLALRLLASAFDDQVGTSLDQYIESLQSFLPKARDKWTEEDRHESLRASFDFTMNNLVKTEEGEELQIAFSRLSVFTAFFYDFTAAPVLENRYPENEEEGSRARARASNMLQVLWERGLLERATIPLVEEKFYLYRLHPALEFFARERLTEAETVQENYWKSMSSFAAFAEDQIDKSQLIAQIALRAIPDLLIASETKSSSKAVALMQVRVSTLVMQYGLYDDALRLAKKSLEVSELLNNPKGKSGALHNMAVIQQARGDLDGAMRLYQQSIEIDEGLGDQQNKATTLSAMAEIYLSRGDLNDSARLFQDVLEIFEELGELESKTTTMRWIAEIEFEKGNIEKALEISQDALEIANKLGDSVGRASSMHQIAKIFVARGDTDRAMNLYQQTHKILEGLGDARGKSATLHEMANIFVTRGDLDRALKLYQQALQILEDLGNLEGKSATLANMGVVLFQSKQYPLALRRLVEALTNFEKMGAQLAIQSTANLIIRFRQALGANKFDKLWQEEINKPIPEWLTK